MSNSSIRIQEKDFDLGAEIAALRKGDPRVGAAVSFLGTVRDMNDGSQVNGMTLEYCPGMTEKALQEILDQAKARWDIYQTLVIYRVGPLLSEDQIVLVAVTSAHRGLLLPASSSWTTLKRQLHFGKKKIPLKVLVG